MRLFKIIYTIVLCALLFSCAKEKSFPVPRKAALHRPTRKCIYKVDVLSADYSVCSSHDADLKPDFYLAYGYHDFSNNSHFTFSSVKYNIPQDSLPISINLTDSVFMTSDVYYRYEWYIYDLDGASINPGYDDMAGGYYYEGGYSGGGNIFTNNYTE